MTETKQCPECGQGIGSITIGEAVLFLTHYVPGNEGWPLMPDGSECLVQKVCPVSGEVFSPA